MAFTFDDRENSETAGRLSRRDMARLMSLGAAALVLPAGVGAAPRQAAPAGTRPQRGTGPAPAFRLSSNENNYGLAPAAI